MKTALTLAAVLGVAAAAPRAHAEEPQTRQVVAGSEYSASGIHQLLFGADYRKLWTTPVTVEVLDLQKEAGGLAPVRRVGGEQTKGLALKGKDGRNYTFRGLEKGIPSALLEEELKGTVVERTLKDQMSGQ
ncbi:MAG TPA: hypothetical protein VF310_02465, partial [Vicinamibacteria bacterium]